MTYTHILTNTHLNLRQVITLEPDEQFEVTLKNQAKGKYPATVIGIERTLSLPTDPNEPLRGPGRPFALIKPHGPNTVAHSVWSDAMEEEDWAKVEAFLSHNPLPTGVTLDFIYDVC